MTLTPESPVVSFLVLALCVGAVLAPIAIGFYLKRKNRQPIVRWERTQEKKVRLMARPTVIHCEQGEDGIVSQVTSVE